MAKILDGDLLVVDTELTITQWSLTFTLNATGNLVAKDGVTMQALYSKFVKLWDTDATLKKYAFPMSYDLIMVANQPKGLYRFINGWKPSNDATRKMLRDGWWEERSSAGVLNRVYVGVVSRGDVSAGAQLYYQLTSSSAPTDFTYADEVNEAVQVYGDSTNGNFDSRTFFKAYCREYGKTYKSSVLADTGLTGTWPYIIDMLLSNADDPKILANDAAMSGAPYSWITVTYYGTDQTRTIWGTGYPFRTIIEGNGATLEQIYTKIAYLERQNSDIDAGAGSVNGKTADILLTMVGDNGITGTGVYIDNYNSNDANRITFYDKNGVARTNPYISGMTFTFDSTLTAGSIGKYTAYFADLPGSNDYLTDNAIIVKDASGADITGTISGGSISKTFDYDGNVQGGRTAGTDASIVIVCTNPGNSTTTVTNHTITRAVGQTIVNKWSADPVYTA